MIKLSDKQKNISKIVIKELFYFLSVLSASLFILDIIFKGLVSAYLNLNFLLLIWIIVAFADLKFNKLK